MAYILALDQGTTSSRAILFDEAGSIAAVAQHEFEQFYPQPGWVEHDPTEILTSQLTCAVEALGKAGARPRDVAAIGITNQRETVIVWERETGKPIHPAIVWQDRRTAAQCEALEKSGVGEEVSSKTGLVLDPYFSATKVRWILDNVPGARSRAERGELAFGTVDSWLDLAPDQREAARDGRDECFAHAALQHREGRVGCGVAAHLRHSGEHAAEGGVVERSHRRRHHDSGAGRRDDCGHCGRPAGGAVRAALLECGRGEEHLRHRLFSAAEYRATASLCGRSTG